MLFKKLQLLFVLFLWGGGGAISGLQSYFEAEPADGPVFNSTGSKKGPQNEFRTVLPSGVNILLTKKNTGAKPDSSVREDGLNFDHATVSEAFYSPKSKTNIVLVNPSLIVLEFNGVTHSPHINGQRICPMALDDTSMSIRSHLNSNAKGGYVTLQDNSSTA